MARIGDMARMMAAQGGLTGMSGGPEETPGLEAPPEGELEGATGDPMSELMGALDSIEGAIPQLPEGVGEKMRQHVEGLRALIEEAGASLNQEEPPKMMEAPGAGPGPMAGPEMGAGEDLGGL